MQTMIIGEIFTKAQIELAKTIYKKHKGAISSELHHEMKEKVIDPNMAQINRNTGQENDPNYFSYLMVYVMGEAERKGML